MVSPVCPMAWLNPLLTSEKGDTDTVLCLLMHACPKNWASVCPPYWNPSRADS